MIARIFTRYFFLTGLLLSILILQITPSTQHGLVASLEAPEVILMVLQDEMPETAFQNKEIDWAKDVFKTFKEINQLELVKQAGIRQQYVDQSVSLNLAFPSEVSPKWINQIHIEAWKQGIKTLYYMRTESVLRGDIAARAMDPDCLSCDG